MTAATDKPYSGGWYEERNERRRERYHGDPEYREKANTLARNGYRDSKGQQQPFDPRVNLNQMATFGKVRTYEGDTTSMANLSFSKGEVAAVFGRPAKQVQQWAADNRIPQPVHRAKVEGEERNWIAVYTPEEVRAMVEALGPHFSDMIYFRCDHIEAIKAVHAAIEKVRG